MEHYQQMLAVRESFTKDPFIVPLPDAEYATSSWPAGILNSFKLTQLKVNSKVLGKKTVLGSSVVEKLPLSTISLDSPFINI